MTSTNNDSAVEPAPIQPSESSAPAIAPSHTQDAIRRKPSSVLVPVPVPDDSTSPVSAVSTDSSTHGATPSPTSSTTNGNAVPTQTDTFEKERASRDHAEERAGVWSRLASFCSRLLSDWWIFELAAGFLSLAAMASIFGVLMAYDQKPVPPLARGITLNAVISFLATISRTSIMLSVGTALSQCKWLWFTKEHDLADLQSIDDASRGPLGSLVMLFNFLGGIIASLAAFVTVGVLGFDPFVQQLLTTKYKVVGEPSHGVYINSVSSMTQDIELALGSSETDAQLIAAMLAEVQQDPQQNDLQRRAIS